MFNRSSENVVAADNSNEQLSPTIRYFIEKSNGNTELSNLEKDALAFMEYRSPGNPTEKYFAQKIGIKFCGGRGFIPPYMSQNILNHYEREAMEFVRRFNQVNQLTP